MTFIIIITITSITHIIYITPIIPITFISPAEETTFSRCRMCSPTEVSKRYSTPSASNHKAFQEFIHHFYHCSPKVTNNSNLQVSFGTRSKECRKSLWKLVLNNNNKSPSSPTLLPSLHPKHHHSFFHPT